jgi:hypothetical protein
MALWPQAAALLNGAISPWLGQSAAQAMASFQFEDKGTLKRFVGNDGVDMGWQFTGKLSFDEDDARRVTLYGGFKADTGLYISLKLPAVKGRNDLTFNLSAKRSDQNGRRGLQADYVFTGRKGEDRLSAKGVIRLESADSPEGEQIIGSIRLDSLLAPGQTQRRRLTLKPELLIKDDQLSGTLAVTQEQGTMTTLSLDLTALLKTGELSRPLAEAGAKDLQSMTPGALQVERDSFLQALLQPLKDFLLSLPDRQRAQLLHDMGRTQRTQGESVPPLPLSDPENFVVSDISVEEDNP